MRIKSTERVVIRTKETDFSASVTMRSFDYTHVMVKAVNIPKTFYTLPVGGNIVVSESAGDIMITFEKGNYSYKSFRRILETKLNAASPGYTYSVSLSSPSSQVDTLKYTMNVINNDGFQPSVRTENQWLARFLGVEVGVAYQFDGNVLTPPNVRNFQSYDELILKSNISNATENILTEIYSSGVASNDSIISISNDMRIDLMRIERSVFLNREINFQLLDIDGNAVDLNGAYWSFILVFVKEDTSYEDVVKNYIDFKLEEASL